MKDGFRARNLTNDSGSKLTCSTFPHSSFLAGFMFQLPESESRSPFQRANSLAELLHWNDLDFVRCAYVTILGRQPDLPGQTQFVQRIREGDSKHEVLWRLRRSPEGKQHDPGIAGLDRALRRAAWQRRAFLGVLPRFLHSDADGNSRTDRALRSLMSAISVNQRHLEVIGERLSAHPTLPKGHATPALAAADQGAQSASLGKGGEGKEDETPELDHLRQKRMIERCAGDIAP